MMVGLVVGAVLLSGCAAKEKASTSLPAPTSTAAPTTAALPPMGPPDFPVPAAARTKDAAGAEAFLRYYIELLNRQQAIPAGGPIRQLGPDCRECLRIASVFEASAGKKERYEGGRVTVTSIATPEARDDMMAFSFLASGEAIRHIDQNGKLLELVPADARLGCGMTLAWSNATKSWLVSSLTLG